MSDNAQNQIIHLLDFEKGHLIESLPKPLAEVQAEYSYHTAVEFVAFLVEAGYAKILEHDLQLTALGKQLKKQLMSRAFLAENLLGVKGSYEQVPVDPAGAR